jgi:hypothetical protein
MMILQQPAAARRRATAANWWDTDANLQGWWPFTATLADATANGYDLTPNGDAAISGTPAALTLDGTGDFARLTASDWRAADTLGALTLWIKTASTATQVFFCTADNTTARNRYLIMYLSSGSIFISSRNGVAGGTACSGGSGLADGAWHMLTIVSDGSAYSFFADGAAVTPLSGTNNGRWVSFPELRDNMVIGAQVLNTVDFGVVGQIGGTSYFDRVLTPTEVGQIYNGTKAYYGL